jgi:adenine deaminase
MNFEELWPLLLDHAESCMLCSDDKHPDDLVEGHINQLCARAVAKGVPLFHVLRAACVNPVLHYGLRNGILREGDPADFVRLGDLANFKVLETFLDGVPVAREGSSLLPEILSPAINKFHCREKSPSDFAIPATGRRVRVIEALDGQIVTGSGEADARIENGQALANPSRDLLKITVVNRYADAPPAVAFVRGVGLREGAVASSVAHDCHNLVAVGASDEALARAINLLIENQGGICVVDGAGSEEILPLPIAGLMSNAPAAEVAATYSRLTQRAKALGSPLHAPFMTLSFLALLVIPSLKLGDRGLFDGNRFEFTSVFAD